MARCKCRWRTIQAFEDPHIPDATDADIMKAAETSVRSCQDVEPFAVNRRMIFDGIMMSNTLGGQAKKRRRQCRKETRFIQERG